MNQMELELIKREKPLQMEAPLEVEFDAETGVAVAAEEQMVTPGAPVPEEG